MSFANPTPLRIGATGTLNGWRVRVAGRVVLGVRDGGETYYWNEYNLAGDQGTSATLVYEETESGPEWKLFRAFEPSHPLDARAAAAKNVGDTVNLDGRPLPITLTGTSRVYHIEGQAPEGVEVGDIASYFNADTGNRMLVASWTGHEIEFYEGLDVPAVTLAAAFGLNASAFPAAGFSTGSAAGTGTSTASRFTKIVIALLGFSSFFSLRSCFTASTSDSVASAPRPKLAAPAQRLAGGAAGTLAMQRYVVAAHAVVEVARASGRHDRREYLLRDESNQEWLLVNGLSGGAREWHLLHPASPAPAGTPYDAAVRKVGATVGVEGSTVRVVDLFQAKVLAADGILAANTLPGVVQYGFVAREGASWVIARWNEDRIQWYRGGAIPDTDVLAALGGPK
jgi:hypothetical protein